MIQDAVLDVSDWVPDEDYPIFQIGTRSKSLLIAPKPGSADYIRPGHRYLFKESDPRYPNQYWAEILAYAVGNAVDVSVPAAFAATNSATGISGALISWFYDGADEKSGLVRFFPGGDYFKRLIPNFDFKVGRQHNLVTALRLLKAFRNSGLPSPVAYWGRVLAFDALIGNTDRHQENWGLLWTWCRGQRRPAFAPAFDNGTSLGNEILEAKLLQFSQQPALDRYISKGKQHMRWNLGSERMSHFEFLTRFANAYPVAKTNIRKVAKVPFGQIEEAVLPILRLAETKEYSCDRSCFVLTALKRRHMLLGQI